MLADTFLIPFVSKKQSRKQINNNFLVISSDSFQIVVEDKGNYYLGGDRMSTTSTFITVPEIQEWEESFLRTKAASMDMTLAEFYTVYEKDVRPKLKENTWWSKEHIIRTKLIPYFGVYNVSK